MKNKSVMLNLISIVLRQGTAVISLHTTVHSSGSGDFLGPWPACSDSHAGPNKLLGVVEDSQQSALVHMWPEKRVGDGNEWSNHSKHQHGIQGNLDPRISQSCALYKQHGPSWLTDTFSSCGVCN